MRLNAKQLTAILLLGIALVLLRLIPLSVVENGPELCIIKRVTGMECPGCGMTRAFFHCLHLNFKTAFTYNKKFVIVFPLLLYLIGKQIRRLTPFKKRTK